MAFALKVHENPKGNVVAACDQAVLGETFSENDITLHVKESFYDGGDDADLDRITSAIEFAMTANIVGDELITALVDRGVIDEDEIRHIDGVPHIQLFFV